ncbi:hypothetical protein PAXRUDRAFT_834864 [Paxillus rubicundulus Ve08.2h10]|uniref:Uncharacterized protein n=1 Tax=Paxillus rubicundulus Ve08.2h10 TaxID=930991 RepID=A0A0D0CR02_9AGAM|nr:hypothetical protein PAXRUDRAFT_834864 [Paxillus rubicundulus Ve08.2h10]
MATPAVTETEGIDATFPCLQEILHRMTLITSAPARCKTLDRTSGIRKCEKLTHFGYGTANRRLAKCGATVTLLDDLADGRNVYIVK